MRKTNYANLSDAMFGTLGQFFYEVGGLQGIWKTVYADMYGLAEKPAEESIQRYSAGTSRVPRRLRITYACEQGQQMLYNNLLVLLQSSTSIRRIYTIQDRVYTYVSTLVLPDDVRHRIISAYVGEQASVEQIAVFLASCLHAVITAS